MIQGDLLCLYLAQVQAMQQMKQMEGVTVTSYAARYTNMLSTLGYSTSDMRTVEECELTLLPIIRTVLTTFRATQPARFRYGSVNELFVKAGTLEQSTSTAATVVIKGDNAHSTKRVHKVTDPARAPSARNGRSSSSSRRDRSARVQAVTTTTAAAAAPPPLEPAATIAKLEMEAKGPFNPSAKHKQGA